GIAESRAKKLRPWNGSRAGYAPPDLAGIMRKAEQMAAHRTAGEARRVTSPDHGADRASRDRHGPHAHLVERLDDRDMRQAPCAACAKRKRKALHAPTF